eukprot:32376_1
MATQVLDTTTYKSWSGIDLVNWIVSIDSAYEHKYKQMLLTSLAENGINGRHIDTLDREDLNQWGIVNLTDKKKIYGAIQTLIVTTKRHNNINHTADIVTSLSDDEEMDTKPDKLTLLTDKQRQQLNTNGYCVLNDPLTDIQTAHAVQGYIRNNFSAKCMIPDLIRTIMNFYHSRYNVDLYVELICTNIEDDSDTKSQKYETFLVPRKNIVLSELLRTRMDTMNRIEIDDAKVNTETMHFVLKYLGHHEGRKPEAIAKPIRSVHLERIVNDPWDADYINQYPKKIIFKLILAANYLDCPSLLHLGCAKIATLIKGKSPEEIKNILAD